ncbi:MAG TPA: NAD-dependent epimerase/dehydratase family protein [Gemmatimonadaceae bacterium]|nr:NAD-dependent epimerase/dehydratase family protein [Gemmatimonadaceae bacterium]
MKVLVTGGLGFTGSALCRRLAQEGHEVTALDSKHGLFDDELTRLGVRARIGSVTDRALVGTLTAGCDRVYHLAAAFRLVNLGKRQYHDVNVNGTRWVMEAALEHGVERVVYCSTCGVHGDVKHPPATETSPVRPADYYQQTKWEGEVVARAFLARGLWVSIVRPTAIYGPGDPERFLLIYRRVAHGHFTFLGDGSAHYHPVFIENLIDGILLASEQPRAKGQSYLIADERSLPIRELVVEVGNALGVDVSIRRLPFWPAYLVAGTVEALYKPFPVEPPIFRRRLDWFRQNRSFDIGKARRELGYEPRVDIPTGLKRTGEWYRQQGLI